MEEIEKRIRKRLKTLKKEEKELLRYGGVAGLALSVFYSYRISELEKILECGGK